MAQSLSKILLHIIFSTKDRYPFLKDPETRSRVHAYMAGICQQQNSPALLIGGLADHVHLLCQLSRTCCMADLVKETKRSSSLWIEEKEGMLEKFAWQGGYGAFSIGQSQVDEVSRYISCQEAHHHHLSFQDEYRQFLSRYKIEYDESYVWD
jgi:putative transposase